MLYLYQHVIYFPYIYGTRLSSLYLWVLWNLTIFNREQITMPNIKLQLSVSLITNDFVMMLAHQMTSLKYVGVTLSITCQSNVEIPRFLFCFALMRDLLETCDAFLNRDYLPSQSHLLHCMIYHHKYLVTGYILLKME